MTVAELRARLSTASPPERTRLLGKILREARDTDVWRFTSPAEVSSLWPELSRHLGRRRGFWEFLLRQWRELDLLDLFVTKDVLEEGLAALGAVARELSATSEEILTTPDFRRRLLRRGRESVIVDLLCTLLARAEVRDLVDLRALEGSGLELRLSRMALPGQQG